MPTLNPLEPSPSPELESAATVTAPELETEATDTATTDSTTVESSATNTPGSTPTSLFDAISRAVDGAEATAVSPAAEKAKETTPAAETPKQVDPATPAASADADADKDKPKEGDEELPPFHTHPRWQKVTGDLRTARGELETVRAEVDSYREDAEMYRGLNAFMTENRLSEDHVNQVLEISALANNGDPRAALEKLRPFYQQLQRQTGEILPDDVGALVENGEMTEAAAQELARTRAELATRQELAQRQATENEQAQRARNTADVQGAVNAWQARIAASNPDFAAVQGDVFNRLLRAQHETPARNAQEAVALAEKALADALAYARSLRPAAPVPITPAPVATVATPNPKPVVRSIADAVNLAMQAG